MWRGVALIAAMLVAFPSASSSQEPAAAALEEPPSEPPSESPRGPTNVVEVEAFLDGLMAAHLSDHEIVGATVAVVRDGEVMFTHGYGWADREARRPVDAERTLFRIGSVSKLFTWTSVMQLVEQGKADLDENVETYLDFSLPSGEPITLRHLMTHTPGFEDRALGLFGETDLSRRDYLVEHMPARVRPPGSFSAYSNYGTTLAGHVVERISGMSWEDYVDRNVLEPLGMEYATAHQPIPEPLEPWMSKGYAGSGGNVQEMEFEMIEGSAPAGSVSASAAAMAKFMLTYLGGGALGETRILEEGTVERMLTRQFTHDDRLNGFGLGFYEKSSHGVRALGHGGDTGWFHTDLAILPAEQLGVFVSYNTASGGEVSFSPFFDAFLDHYYPSPAPTFVEADQAEIARIAGTYQFNRGSYTTFEKALRLAGAVELAADDGELVVQSPLGQQRFRPLGGGLYREVDGSVLLAFREGEQGEVTHVFLSFVPMMALERMGALSSPSLHLALLGGALAIFVLSIVAFPIRWFLRRRYKAPVEGGGERRARLLALLASIVGVVFCLGLVSVASSSSGLIRGETGILSMVLTFGVVLGLLAVALIGATVVVWRRSFWSVWGRLRYTLVALAAVLFVLSLNAWNLLGWKLG